jgi:Ca2+-binding RTX toxin-like protein
MQTHVNLYQADGFFDGNDTISGGEANDFVFGGEGNDTVFGDFDPDAYLALPAVQRPPVAAGRDVLIGDGGRVELSGRRLDFVKSLPSAGAGDDTISGNGNEDVIIGGGGGDDLFGRFDEAVYTPAELDILDENLGLTPADEGWISDEDILIGDDGNIDYDHTISNVLNYIETNILDADARTSGGVDTAFGSRDNDIIFGGLKGDILDGSVGDDVIFGDNGRIEYHPGKIVADLRTDMTQLFSTDTTDATGGADDVEGAEGEDVIIGGVNGVVVTETDVLKGSDDKDIILGDNALLRWNVAVGEFPGSGFGDDILATLDLITTKDFGIGGDDWISGANDDDILIGGKGGDLIKGDNSFVGALALLPGSDVAIGDQGRVTFFGGIRTRVQAIDELETQGGIDTIEGNADRDIIIGGVQGDFLYGEAALLAEIDAFGDDIILGDEGLLRWDVDGLTPEALGSLDLIESEDDADLEDGDTLASPTLGGVDEIWGNGGRDVAMGGTAGDFIYGDAGDPNQLDVDADDRDILLGDNGRVILAPADGDPVFDGDLGTLGDGFVVWGGGVSIISTTDVLAETGGKDTIDGNEADDVILGGAQGDLLSGNDDDDIILGDEGRLEWLYDGSDDVAGVEDDLPGPEFDSSFTTLDLITTFLPVPSAPYPGGRDIIYGDTAASVVDAGEDVIFGGTDLDVVQGGPNTVAQLGDVIFGDYGRLSPQNSLLEFFPSRNFYAIDTGDLDGGEATFSMATRSSRMRPTAPTSCSASRATTACGAAGATTT